MVWNRNVDTRGHTGTQRGASVLVAAIITCCGSTVSLAQLLTEPAGTMPPSTMPPSTMPPGTMPPASTVPAPAVRAGSEARSAGKLVYRSGFESLATLAQQHKAAPPSVVASRSAHEVHQWRALEWCAENLFTTPSGQIMLGRFHNTKPDGGIVLGLQQLPSHSHLIVAADVIISGDWTGDGVEPKSGTAFGIGVDQSSITRWTMAVPQAGGSAKQSYPAMMGQGVHPAGHQAASVNVMKLVDARSRPIADAVYRVVAVIEHAGPAANVRFVASGLPGDVNRANWSLDNVVIMTASADQIEAVKQIAAAESIKTGLVSGYAQPARLDGIDWSQQATTASSQGVLPSTLADGSTIISSDFAKLAHETMNVTEQTAEAAKRLKDPWSTRSASLYASDFGLSTSRWSSTSTMQAVAFDQATLHGSGKFLGPFHNQIVRLDVQDITSGLVDGDDLILSADVLVAGDWRGQAGGTMTISADNREEIFATTFANQMKAGDGSTPKGYTQHYPGSLQGPGGLPAATGALSILGPESAAMEQSLYRLMTVIPGGAMALRGVNELTFAVKDLPGTVQQSAWGLGNVRLTSRGLTRSTQATSISSASSSAVTTVQSSSGAIASAWQRLERVVYQSSFSAGLDESWQGAQLSLTPRGEAALGPFHNQSVALKLTDLPPHEQLIIDVDMSTVGYWAGNGLKGPDGAMQVDPSRFFITLDDGRRVFATTLANEDGTGRFRQLFPDGHATGRVYPPGTLARFTNQLGYSAASGASGPASRIVTDSTYLLRFVIPHDKSSAALNFGASGLAGNASNSYWLLHGVKVRSVGQQAVDAGILGLSGGDYRGGGYSNSFAVMPVGSQWGGKGGSYLPGGEGILGPMPPGEAALTLTDLPPHTHLSIAADVLVMGDWAGNGKPGEIDPSTFTVKLADGRTVYATSFARVDRTDVKQAFPDQLGEGDYQPGHGASGMNVSGLGVADAVYRLFFTIPHTDGAQTIRFIASGLPTGPGSIRFAPSAGQRAGATGVTTTTTSTAQSTSNVSDGGAVVTVVTQEQLATIMSNTSTTSFASSVTAESSATATANTSGVTVSTGDGGLDTAAIWARDAANAAVFQQNLASAEAAATTAESFAVNVGQGTSGAAAASGANASGSLGSSSSSTTTQTTTSGGSTGEGGSGAAGSGEGGAGSGGAGSGEGGAGGAGSGPGGSGPGGSGLGGSGGDGGSGSDAPGSSGAAGWALDNVSVTPIDLGNPGGGGGGFAMGDFGAGGGGIGSAFGGSGGYVDTGNPIVNPFNPLNYPVLDSGSDRPRDDNRRVVIPAPGAGVMVTLAGMVALRRRRRGQA